MILDVGGFFNACGDCPQLDRPGPTDLSNQIWERKKALFERLSPDKIHFVAPSSWLADEVRKSPILGRFPLSVVPYGLDLDDFAPRDKSSAREVFGIPHQAKVVLFIADGLPLMRKGFDKLVESIERILIKLPHLYLVVVGNNSPELKGRIPHLTLGPVNNDRLLSNIYRQPMFLRFLLCRIIYPIRFLNRWPVAPRCRLRCGRDSRNDPARKTGLLVPPHDVALFGSALLELLRSSERLTTFGENCRNVALQRFSLAQQAASYTELYGRLLNGHI